MPLQESGAISLDDMHVIVGGTTATVCTINDADIRAITGVGSGATSSFSSFYGLPLPSWSLSSANFTNRTNATRTSTYVSNALTATVTSGPIDATITAPAGNPGIQINSTGPYATTKSVANGNTVRAHLTASPAYSTTRTSTTTANGDSATYSVTTGAQPNPGPTCPFPSSPFPTCLAWGSEILFYSPTIAEGVVGLVEDVKVGDKLLAFRSPTMPDENNPNWLDWENDDIDGPASTNTYTTVEYAERKRARSKCIINTQIICTAHHPFLVKDPDTLMWSWKRSIDLDVGMIMRTADGGEEPITEYEISGDTIEVMSINVEPLDNFYGGNVSGKHVLNHNK